MDVNLCTLSLLWVYRILVTLILVLWRCWLGGRKGIWPVKKLVVQYLHGYLPGARCKWSAYGPTDATATPSSLAPVKSRMIYLSGASLPRLCWKKPLNDVVVVVVDISPHGRKLLDCRSYLHLTCPTILTCSSSLWNWVVEFERSFWHGLVTGRACSL